VVLAAIGTEEENEACNVSLLGAAKKSKLK
jgi:hypothetical protein